MANSIDSLTSNRLTSLYSGLDTDALVKNAVATDQAKIDKMFQAKEKATWRLEAYNEIYKEANAMRSDYLSVLGSNSMTSASTYNVFKTTLAENDAVSITAGASALPTSFNILSTTAATAGSANARAVTGNTRAWGQNAITVPEGTNLMDMKVEDLREAFGLAEGEDLEFAVNGETPTLKFDGEATLGDIQSALAEKGISLTASTNPGEDGKTNVSFTFDAGNTNKMTLTNVTGKAFGDGGFFGVSEGAHTAEITRDDTILDAMRKRAVTPEQIGALDAQIAAFTADGVTLNGKNFTFDPEKTTLRSMMNTINTDTDADVTFNFSELSNSFSVTNNKTGAANALEVEGLEAFGLSDATISGTDASMTVMANGVQSTVSSDSNTITKDGITFEIKGNYDAAGGAGLAATVARDTQPTVDAMKKFVESYNSLIEKLNKYYTEDVNSKYPPLTDEQREELSEDEAKKWDEKAKSGILHNDSAIGNLLTSLRSQLLVKNEETGLSMMDLGISTTSWSADDWKTSQGKLVLDEKKLESMLQADPMAVQKTMNAVDTTGVASTVPNASKDGFFTRVSNIMKDFSSTMRGSVISDTTKKISDYTDDMDELLSKLYDKQESYYLKYAQMEKLLSQLQSQSEWLGSQMSIA
ncbi:MAG: flagellar filament capping protein FliD [Eubacteriales bacterium]|nr:flagellar filament capping protein FliD [Eubacteriales bacterium]